LLRAAPSLASPINVRRQAWLTAIQTVWVPRHNLFLEAAALGLKTLKLSLRNLIGIKKYQQLTGLTEEQELARVKAWTVALDAQLTGGDVEVSKSRLTLTLLASGTLHATPLRLMLRALHLRVLLWDTGFSEIPLGIVDSIAAKLARAMWNDAKQRYKLSQADARRGVKQNTDDELPAHLAELLEQDCDDVLNPSIIQRAHNLAWNRPTELNSIGPTDGMDTIVDDIAVRSPMDAVAAWWSTMTLHGALTRSLSSEDEDEEEASRHIEHDISSAIRTAPVGSTAASRALVARALLLKQERGANIISALHAIGPVTPSIVPSELPGTLGAGIPAPVGISPLPELETALLCAMAIAHLQKFSAPEEPSHIYSLIDGLRPSCDMGLLGYAATSAFMLNLAAHEHAAETCASTLERISGMLRIWTGKTLHLEPELRRQMVDRCLDVTRGIVGMSIDTDTGYGSMTEDEGDITSDAGQEADVCPSPIRTQLESDAAATVHPAPLAVAVQPIKSTVSDFLIRQRVYAVVQEASGRYILAMNKPSAKKNQSIINTA
jgi:hypothetical protein